MDSMRGRIGARLGSKPAPPPSAREPYTVKAGDTLTSIARAHGVTVDALVKANGIKDPNKITAGQKLAIPASGGTPPKPPAPKPPAVPKYEPYPGAAFFKAGRTSPVITAMGKRLVAEGCSRYAVGPGPKWSEADRQSYAAWQRKLGYSGPAADGIPGKTSWDKLRVPNV